MLDLLILVQFFYMIYFHVNVREVNLLLIRSRLIRIIGGQGTAEARAQQEGCQEGSEFAAEDRKLLFACLFVCLFACLLLTCIPPRLQNIQSKQIACQWCKTMFMKTMSREQYVLKPTKDPNHLRQIPSNTVSLFFLITGLPRMPKRTRRPSSSASPTGSPLSKASDKRGWAQQSRRRSQGGFCRVPAITHASELSVAKHDEQGKLNEPPTEAGTFHICISEGVNRIIICV